MDENNNTTLDLTRREVEALRFMLDTYVTYGSDEYKRHAANITNRL